MVLSAADMTLGTDNADEQILWAIGHLCVSLPPQCLGRLEDMLLVVTPCASLVPACVAFVVLPVPTDKIWIVRFKLVFEGTLETRPSTVLAVLFCTILFSLPGLSS